jgi:hypothetical protein
VRQQSWHNIKCLLGKHRVIHKSLWDFRPLRYGSQNGHAKGEHVNRGRDTPSFCPTLQLLDMCTLGDILSTWKTFLALARQSRPMAPASLFVSQHTGSHSAGIPCTTNKFFLSVCGSLWYTVRNLRCTVTIDSVLVNSKTQNAFLFPAQAKFHHDCPLAVKPASMPRHLVHQKMCERFSTYWYAPFCCVCLGCCAAEFGSSGGTYELLYISIKWNADCRNNQHAGCGDAPHWVKMLSAKQTLFYSHLFLKGARISESL